ncbi:small oligopeptide transporter [Aspergillus eucalypticola CBS 122712]|uniref:Small oligopeptide transporter n=1 Tax=Aspergillus eucalypticola (strain CBS 122712 / IBT 29274) TaxID=1448314 RepID=A0A317VM24_ASPEC|nr:small oligopeptide transporter [Aspergillus eucalypticola CBS 122712]PWY74905.1 small oligopeptide transporter [Aspergillus eucalypticola CBS 122712]
MSEKEQAFSTAVADESSPEAATVHLKNLKEQHHWDPNLPDDIADEIDEALHTDDKGARVGITQELLDNSPYPEVRAAVPNYDEGGHTNTLRAWAIGLIFATIGSALNMLFSMRDPYIVIPSYVAQVVAYPVGVAWAKFVPSKKFRFFGIECNTNPGPFSKKEHCLIVVMANATFGGGAAYATDVLLAQRAFYNQRFGWAFEIFMCISTQMLGFGMAGFFHRFLVTPAAMIWPSNLINCTLFSALHDHSRPDPTKVAGWRIGKYRFFLYVMIGSFCWYWIPGVIAPFLSVFAWVTWIKPQNAVINQLFGGDTGLSLIPMTFDWTQISGFNFSPLIAPWHAIANTLIGMFIFFWIVTIGMHYSGMWWFEYLPISDSNSYDNTGAQYNVSRIMNSDFTLNVQAYKEYSPLFLSTTFSLCYGLSFATIIAILIHTGLFHGKELWVRFRNFGKEEEDVHARLMSKYKPVPLWWYAAVTLIMIGIGLGMVLGYPTHLSWWAFFVSLIMAMVWYVPIGIVQAATNIAIGLNVLTEFIVGYIQPGKPMAMMLFKTYGYMSMYQGLYFNQDMKLAHYMKLPPRVTFAAQMIAAVWSSVVQIAVMNWGLATIKDVCSETQADNYTCPNGRVFYQASVIWGLIGPQRIFSPGQLYSGLMWFWLAGAILPVVIYIGARMYPKSQIRFLNAPLIFGGAGLIPPATPLNYLTWGLVGIVFNKYIRDRWRGWWMHYNYVLSAGLDVGLDLCTILIFLTLDLTSTSFPTWWGTSIASDTMDMAGTAVQKTVPAGQTFGPKSW